MNQDIAKNLPHLLSDNFTTPIVILPFYGEFGYFLQSYIRIVHYLKSPYKIVCIKPGDELYFPSASEFYYDWEDLFSDVEKCGFRNSWPITPSLIFTSKEIDLRERLNKKFPDAEIICIDEPLPLTFTPQFPVCIQPSKLLDLKTDILICARQRKNGEHGHDQRNFECWEAIVNPLLEMGYKIAQIGKEETSYHLPEIQIRSWDYKEITNTIVSMLLTTRLYIGTDTGPTQLAALLETPMVLFRRFTAGNPDLIKNIVLPIASQKNFRAQLIQDGWSHPEKVAAAALDYLTTL